MNGLSDVNIILEKIAQKHQVSVKEVIKEIENAIDIAWSSNNFLEKSLQLNVFGKNKTDYMQFILKFKDFLD